MITMIGEFGYRVRVWRRHSTMNDDGLTMSDEGGDVYSTIGRTEERLRCLCGMLSVCLSSLWNAVVIGEF